MLKEKIVQYRDDHRESRVLFSAVIGELDRISKTPTDEECLQVIKKMIESNALCGLHGENEILQKFLPVQLSPLQVEGIMISKVFKDLGTCMKFFKENYPGQYEGKMVSNMFKRF